MGWSLGKALNNQQLSLQHGTTATVSCADGFEAKPESQKLTCKEGEWTKQSINCVKIPFFKQIFVEKPFIGISAAGGILILLIIVLCVCYKFRKHKTTISSLQARTQQGINLNFDDIDEPKPQLAAASSVPPVHFEDTTPNVANASDFHAGLGTGFRIPATNPGAEAGLEGRLFTPELSPQDAPSVFQAAKQPAINPEAVEGSVCVVRNLEIFPATVVVLKFKY